MVPEQQPLNLLDPGHDGQEATGQPKNRRRGTILRSVGGLQTDRRGFRDEGVTEEISA